MTSCAALETATPEPWATFEASVVACEMLSGLHPCANDPTAAALATPSATLARYIRVVIVRLQSLHPGARSPDAATIPCLRFKVVQGRCTDHAHRNLGMPMIIGQMQLIWDRCKLQIGLRMELLASRPVQVTACPHKLPQ